MTGWGQALRERMRGRAAVANYAVPGSSTRLYFERHWPRVRAHLAPGDCLLIQFGHIDALPDPARHTEPDGQYPALLTTFISEARASGAQPVLITPVTIYPFGRSDMPDAHKRYSEAMRRLAPELGVPLIDLASLSAQAVARIGEEQARQWFMLSHDGHDTVHLTRVGAEAVADLVQEALEKAGIVRG